MNQLRIGRFVSCCLLIATAVACGPGEVAPPAPPAKPVIEATPERVTLRGNERWGYIVKGDWTAAYPYASAEYQREYPLSTLLRKSSDHRYEGMRVVEVVGRKGEEIYVRCKGLWTPTHPIMRQVELEPGQTLTQEMDLIETWRWENGDWFYVRPQRPEEFAAEHADVLRGETQPAAAPGG